MEPRAARPPGAHAPGELAGIRELLSLLRELIDRLEDRIDHLTDGKH
jgi:hypothetical protein